jgi:preprotein translocase subunit SecD
MPSGYQTTSKWLVLLLAFIALAGCGAIYDSIVGLPEDDRAQVEFYFAQDEYQQGLIRRAATSNQPALYTQQIPILEANDIEQALPMRDAAGYFFVGIKLKDSGARKLARTTPGMIGKRLAVVIDGRLLGAALIDGPIDKGAFAIATNDRNSAFALAQLLNRPTQR